jgi:exopolysaccharide biosynthesis predicted pyruvyltransferase EpsI
VKIVNIHRKNTPNRGDLASAPFKYFSQLKDTVNVDILEYRNPNDVNQKKFLSLYEEANLVILGGGGLLEMPKFQESVDFICTSRNNKVVIWGAGHNSTQLRSWSALGAISISNNIQNSQFIGIRDYNLGYEWVPCASCMSDLFDREYEIKHEVVLFENYTLDSLLRIKEQWGSEGNYLSNFKTSLSDTLAFLGSGETIITNSFHGAYWGTLLGRKVVAIPATSKFYSFKHPVPLCSAKDWQTYKKLAKYYPEALEECRQANLNFRDKVFDHFQIS